VAFTSSQPSADYTRHTGNKRFLITFLFYIQVDRDSLHFVRRREDARGLIVGLTGFNTKAHIVRAALEASAFQVGSIQLYTTLHNTINDDALTIDSQD
jgi:hypothetical protein